LRKLKSKKLMIGIAELPKTKKLKKKMEIFLRVYLAEDIQR